MPDPDPSDDYEPGRDPELDAELERLAEEGAQDIGRGDYVVAKTPEELREIVCGAWAGQDLKALRELIERRLKGPFLTIEEVERARKAIRMGREAHARGDFVEVSNTAEEGALFAELARQVRTRRPRKG